MIYFIIAAILIALAVLGYRNGDKVQNVLAGFRKQPSGDTAPTAPVVATVSPVPTVPTAAGEHPEVIAMREWRIKSGGGPKSGIDTYSMFRNNGLALNPEQEKHAALAGYDMTVPVPQGHAESRAGGNLNGGVVRVNDIQEDSVLSYFFTVGPGGRFVELSTFTHSGSEFRRVECTVTGPKSFAFNTVAGGSSADAELVTQNMPEGDYTVTVKYRDVQGGDRGVGTQCVQSPLQAAHPGHTSY